MFNLLDTRSESGPGPFTSMVAHVAVVAMLITFGSVIHKVTKPLPYIQLVMPQLTVVKIRPAVTRYHAGGGHVSLGSPMLVTAGAPVISPVRHEAAQPQLIAKLDVPSAIELPQGNTHTVAMAPQAKAVGFGGTVAAGGSGPHGTVTGTGFGSGEGTGEGHGEGHGAGKVVTVGFERPAAAVAVKAAQPAFVAPIVTFEPRPRYTDEAAQAHVQGEVTLQVRFRATGTVEILRVVSGLGHGLDDQARRVAEGIRFTPATRDGAPVDHTTLIHVQFQLG